MSLRPKEDKYCNIPSLKNPRHAIRLFILLLLLALLLTLIHNTEASNETKVKATIFKVTSKILALRPRVNITHELTLQLMFDTRK